MVGAMTEINGYLDQLLIEEFHEAGLWLPEEIEARERHREIAERQAKFFASQMQMQAGMTLRVPANQFSGQLGHNVLGSQFLGRQVGGGSAGSGLGGIFGGLFGGLR